jgi:hypothetical protein
VRLFLPSLLLLAASLLAPCRARADVPFAIDIDLSLQKAFLLQDGKIVYETPISSGRPKYRTPTGNFKITEKDANHLSSLYGKIVDANGKTLVRDADSDMPLPPGAKFVKAPMKNFLRFDGATGMHAGQLPGYPASHGCVRLPPHRAALFFDIVEIGTPVRVFGKAPESTPAARPARVAAATPAMTPVPRKWFQIFKPHSSAPRAVRVTAPTTPAVASAVKSASLATPAPAR